jgi:two-component system, chemotaxis family, response regulator Rcp1
MQMINHFAKAIEILLVEDSPSDATLTLETFGEGSFLNHMHVVEDGVEAIAFLRREGSYTDVPCPDLILLDLRTIPVVVLTTSEAEEDIFKSYRLQANCYVSKSLGLKESVRIVRLIESFWLAAAKLPSSIAGWHE